LYLYVFVFKIGLIGRNDPRPARDGEGHSPESGSTDRCDNAKLPNSVVDRQSLISTVDIGPAGSNVDSKENSLIAPALIQRDKTLFRL